MPSSRQGTRAAAGAPRPPATGRRTLQLGVAGARPPRRPPRAPAPRSAARTASARRRAMPRVVTCTRGRLAEHVDHQPGQVVALAVHQPVGGGAIRGQADARAAVARAPAGGPRRTPASTGSSWRVTRRTGICERGFQRPRPMKRPSWSATDTTSPGAAVALQPLDRVGVDPRDARTTGVGPAPGAGSAGRGCRRPNRAAAVRRASAAVGSIVDGTLRGHGGQYTRPGPRPLPRVLFLLR